DFMQKNGERRGESEPRVDKIGRSDQEAIYEIVHRIGCQRDHTHGSDRERTFGGEAMLSPSKDFFEDEEYEDAGENADRRSGRRDRFAKRLGKKVDERIAVERSDGEAHERRDGLVEAFATDWKNQETNERQQTDGADTGDRGWPRLRHEGPRHDHFRA